MGGPLEGIKVLELAGIGPGPYACMLLADLGANVLRLERGDWSIERTASWDVLNRSRYSVAVDLKNRAGRDLVLELCEQADVLVEGFRPGVTERLGLGPDDVWQRNPRLVYGRMTGWGQSGPLSQRAGHDINYIAVSGALWPVGRAGDRPVPPLNLVGDFGGGSMFLALGVLSALISARVTGEGQVVDAAMVDGSASLLAMTHSFMNVGIWSEERGVNFLDTGAPFYEVYEKMDRDLQNPDPRRVDGYLRGRRRLRHPGALASRSRGSSLQRRARRLHHPRASAAETRSAIFEDARRDSNGAARRWLRTPRGAE